MPHTADPSAEVIERTLHRYMKPDDEFLVDDGSRLVVVPQGDVNRVDVRCRITPVRFDIPDESDLLRIDSFVTDSEGHEYGAREYVSTKELCRSAIAVPLTLRRDELNRINSAGRTLASVEETVLIDRLNFHADHREHRPIAVIVRLRDVPFEAVVHHLLFFEWYSRGTFSIAQVKYENQQAGPSGVTEYDSTFLYMTLKGTRTASAIAIGEKADDTTYRRALATKNELTDESVYASRLFLHGLVWKHVRGEGRSRRGQEDASPLLMRLGRTGLTGEPTPWLQRRADGTRAVV